MSQLSKRLGELSNEVVKYFFSWEEVILNEEAAVKRRTVSVLLDKVNELNEIQARMGQAIHDRRNAILQRDKAVDPIRVKREKKMIRSLTHDLEASVQLEAELMVLINKLAPRKGAIA
jgi:hypothetical protein